MRPFPSFITQDKIGFQDKFDSEIVAIATTLESAEEIARQYVIDEELCDGPEKLAELGEFNEWLVEGFECDSEEDPNRIHRVGIEAHELQC